MITHGGTRTHNPQIRSLMRYPLRHAGKEVSPGFEPGLSDSKSEMLTITSRNLLAGVTRTPDKWIYSPLLCQLSYSEKIVLAGLEPATLSS